MRQSNLFTKTRKETPKDEEAKNAKLLMRAGFIHKEMAGVYAYLPLGLRVLKKIETIIRDEMNAIGGQEVELTSLQEKSLWEKTGRWDDEVVDNWFKTKLKNDQELGLAFTHEEPLTALLKSYISSYRDLPCSIYQFQTKFRNELRAKSGIMRGREFLMKDLYSFSRDYDEHRKFYKSVEESYRRIFNRVGIGNFTFFTYASGGSFSDVSHEFQTITEAGEDTIYIREENDYAINKEIFNEEWKRKLDITKFREEKAVEVGNIFNLGTKFSEALGLTYKEIDGSEKPVWMGSYGIGLGRLMGTIVEVLSDEKGIIWPEEVAPFQVHLLSLGEDEAAENLYNTLTEKGIEVLFDERDVSAGEKFADSDLMGIPYRIVVSKKTKGNGGFEVKRRTQDEAELVNEETLFGMLQSSTPNT